jgi:hypothetical protein
MSRFWGLVAFLLLGCSAENGSPDKIAATNYSPELGPLQTFAGVWSLNFEMSNFTYCPHGAENCASAMFDGGGCWLNGLGEKPSQLEKLIGGRVADGDKLYVRFEGRETLKRGQYGHLGAYSCEIHGEKLISAKRITGLPYESE